MKRLLLLVALALSGLAPASVAQQGEVFVQQAEQALRSSAADLTGAERATVALSDAVLRAASESSNVVAVTQEGTGNRLELTQTGVSNRVGLVVVGSQNKFELEQLGDENLFLGEVFGDENTLGPDGDGRPSVQSGDGNTYELVLDGVVGRSHSLRQLGGGNTAYQYVAPGLVPASIEQRGGASITVERR